ncbi:unnamed protein product, partial [Didymodactylos carnosus]
MFTDAPGHDAYSQGRTQALAELKQAKIDVLFVNSTQSRSEIIDELTQFTSRNGGLFMTVNTTRPNTTGEFLFHRLDEAFGYECALFEPISNGRHGTFILDQTATSLRVKAVSSSSSFVFSLINPVGLHFTSTSPANRDYLQMFTIDVANRSNVGEWTYNCSENCAVEVNAQSEFRCRTQVYAPLIDGRFALVVTPPLINQNGVFAITTCDDSNEVLNSSIQLIGTNREFLTNYSTARPDLITPITIPSERFRVRTRVEHRDGTFVYRDERAVIDTSQIVMVVHHQPLTVINNQSLNVSFTIRNYAAIPLRVELHID